MTDDVPAVEVVRLEPVVGVRTAATWMAALSVAWLVLWLSAFLATCRFAGQLTASLSGPAVGWLLARVCTWPLRRRSEWRMSFGQIRERERLARRG